MKAHPLFLYFLKKRLAITTSPFSLVSILFDNPLPSLYWWAVLVGVENGVNQGTISYGASKDLILVHTVQKKAMIKAHFSGKIVSGGISDGVITSVHSEKACLKKLMKRMMTMMMMMMIINHKKEDVQRAPEIDSHHETEARKVMVDFKFDALCK